MSIRSLVSAVLVSSLAAGLSLAAEAQQLDGNRTLFSVMTALRAARSPNPPQIPVMSELRNFVKSHQKSDPGSDLAQYISFALSVSEPPEFRSRFNPNEIPPDVLALEGLDRLMARFDREANVAELWAKEQPAIEREIARYQGSVVQALLEVNGYLRNPTSGYMGRTFQIYLDTVGPANQVQHRSYGDDYFIVMTPSSELQIGEIRHGYFHYLLDPLSIKFSEHLNKKRGLADYAQGSPLLAEQYKSDFLLLATESLIKAIEARLAGGSGEKRQSAVDAALREGFVLTPYFAEALPAYEKQESAMRLYFPDMVADIDLRKEARRLEGVQFARERAAPKPTAPSPPEQSAVTAAEKALEEAETLYTGRELGKAGEKYRRLLELTDSTPLHARAYYGLARIAALERNPQLAEKLFHRTLELSPDPQTQAWTRVYLGRLAAAAGEREQAQRHFQEALAVKGASDGARRAAEQGLSKESGFLNRSKE